MRETRVQDALTAIDPATLSVGDRDDREMLIDSIKGTLLDVETIRYWQKNPVRRATRNSEIAWLTRQSAANRSAG